MGKEAQSEQLRVDQILGMKVDNRKDRKELGRWDILTFIHFSLKKKKGQINFLKKKKRPNCHYPRRYSSFDQCSWDNFSPVKYRFILCSLG